MMHRRSALIVTLALAASLLPACTEPTPEPKPSTPDSDPTRAFTPDADPQSAFTPGAISLQEVPEENAFELIDEHLVFVDAAGTDWVAPQGTLTDGASVPSVGLAITNGRFEATFLKAAIVHDAWCQEFNEHRCPDQYRTRSWQDVHRMFHEACLAGGTPAALANTMYVAVWLFGPRWDDPGSDLDTVATEARMETFEACYTWSKQAPRSLEELDRWVIDRETVLRTERRLAIPKSIQRAPLRQYEPRVPRRVVPRRPDFDPVLFDRTGPQVIERPDIDRRRLDPSEIDPVEIDPRLRVPTETDPRVIDRPGVDPTRGGPG